ncbi:MAG: Rieske (2Fe-2S) protein, partial [Ottowia sp.]|nr:Rieske (2Fe-2S) protein [Ottowia sp.]
MHDGGLAVGFDVVYAGQTMRAFAIRFEGKVHAYLNRCTHVAMEMDYQEGKFFDDSGQWLLCAS